MSTASSDNCTAASSSAVNDNVGTDTTAYSGTADLSTNNNTASNDTTTNNNNDNNDTTDPPTNTSTTSPSTINPSTTAPPTTNPLTIKETALTSNICTTAHNSLITYPPTQAINPPLAPPATSGSEILLNDTESPVMEGHLKRPDFAVSKESSGTVTYGAYSHEKTDRVIDGSQEGNLKEKDLLTIWGLGMKELARKMQNDEL